MLAVDFLDGPTHSETNNFVHHSELNIITDISPAPLTKNNNYVKGYKIAEHNPSSMLTRICTCVQHNSLKIKKFPRRKIQDDNINLNFQIYITISIWHHTHLLIVDVHIQEAPLFITTVSSLMPLQSCQQTEAITYSLTQM
jgi:hypothetical protein